MIQKLEKPGDDWSGYFIRGDNCAALISYWEDGQNGSAIATVAIESFFRDLQNSIT